MRDKRPVDELSIEELERILAIKKREQRMARSERYRDRGRVLETVAPPPIAGHVASDDVPEMAMPQAIAQLPQTTDGTPSENLPQPYTNGQELQLLHEDLEHVGFVEERVTTDPSEFWKRVASWGLLAVEVLAVLGLGYILYLGFNGLETIRDNTNETQSELSAAQEARRATSTPVPELSPYQLVLPGGHVYNPNDRPSFNQAELENIARARQIPANQRSALVQQATFSNVALDTPSQPTDPVMIDIPDIGINRGTVEKGADWATLRAGMGWFQNGANLADGRNIVIVGHNDIYGEIFRELPSLEIGSEITIYDNSGRGYTYRVAFAEQVEPDAVHVLDPNSDADLTLITCYPYQVNTHRWIVYAEQVR